MRVLGIDPGSRTTGWGLIGGEATCSRLVDSGVIRLDAVPGKLADRLGRLSAELDELVRRLCPTSAAVESPFHGANARSALQLAHARGVILAVLVARGVEVQEYTPATVKQAVTGNGRAPKDQVRGMVGRLLGTSVQALSWDRSDALAVALCHAASMRRTALLARVRGQ